MNPQKLDRLVFGEPRSRGAHRSRDPVFVQHRLIASGKIEYFNSPDHDTTRTNVAAERGVCLAPGFLNDHSGRFAWIPFDCGESFSCVLCTHRDDGRKPLSAFIAILKKLYEEAVAFPL